MDTDCAARFGRIFDLSTVNVVNNTRLNGPSNHFLSLVYYRGMHGVGVHADASKALYAAMGEALERHALLNVPPDLEQLSFQRLAERGYKALDPDSFKIFSEDQPALREGLVRNLTRECAVDWLRFENAYDGAEIYLPSCFGGLERGRVPIYFSASSNGAACARDLATAKYLAVLELIERDAVLFYWWTRNSPWRIDVNRPNPEIEAVLSSADDADKITFYYLPNEFGVFPVFAVYRGDAGFLSAAACAFDPVKAMDKALREIVHIQSYIRSAPPRPRVDYAADFDNTVWDFDDHVLLYLENGPTEASAFLDPKNCRTVPWQELVGTTPPDSASALAVLEERMRANGCRLYYRDATSETVRAAGLNIVKAFSPDLIGLEARHRLRQLGVERLYTLADRLGLSHRPREFKELNPFPHPFP
jgi:ribosomal protein S12 methylthiotransferase accessory factor